MTDAPLGSWGPAAATGSGLDASARPARRDAAPIGGAPARLVAPDATRARPADSDPSQATGQGPSRPPVAAPPRKAAPALPEEALQRFAAPFAAPADGRALLSVVLLDQGAPNGPGAVAALPLPASVALDPAAPGAAERMAAYRARGIEVLALAAPPAATLPANGAARAEAMLTVLPEAVAVLDLGEAGLEPGRAGAGPALDHLAERGLGAVLSARSSGAAARLTAAGLPAAALLRDLDGAGEDAAAVRRFLDDAARRAGENGAGEVLARVRPQTLDALALWAEGRRASELALAPVSAVLRDAAPAGTERHP